jgi:PAS domain S-box-containing protein
MPYTYSIPFLTPLEQQLQEIADSQPETCVILDLNLRVLVFNQYAQEYVKNLFLPGLRAGFASSDYVFDDFQATFRNCLEIALRGNKITVDNEFKRQDETSFWRRLSFSPLMVETSGEQIGIVINVENIDEEVSGEQRLNHYNIHLAELVQKRTQELRQKNLQLEAILSSMSDGVLVFNPLDYVISYTNPALLKMFGYYRSTPGDLLHLDEVVDTSKINIQQVVEQIRKIIASESLWMSDLTARRYDGSTFQVHVTVCAIRFDFPTINANQVVTLVRDISQEQHLKEIKDRFIANASHELRTPVTAMKLRAYLLRTQPQNAEKHLNLLERAIDDMVHLIENLLDKTRLEQGLIHLRRTPTQLNTLIYGLTETIAPMAAQRGVQLLTDLPQENLRAVLDPLQIKQALSNLIVNAINYTPTGGTVVVRLRHDPLRQLYQIDVSDTGIGIPPEVIPNLFEPFYRVEQITRVKVPTGFQRPKGTGLGLSNAREIVALHGGQLTVESKLGVGSCFTIRLPHSELPGAISGEN